MNVKDIRELILTIDRTSIQKVEIQEKDFKVQISKSTDSNEKAYKANEKEDEIEKSTNIMENNIDLYEDSTYVVKSPIVGVFYASPSPDSEPFAKIGDNVKKDQSLCIIEAMKIMNEIQSEKSGEIIDILVEDGDIVEYGQALMKIRR